MSLTTISSSLRYKQKHNADRKQFHFDFWLLSAIGILLIFGFIMMGSASVSIAERREGDAFYFMWRQGVYIAVGLIIGWLCLRVKMSTWELINPLLLIAGIFLLLTVLVVGNEVNGSKRWLSFGFIGFQPSELMKFLIVMFLSGYMVRRGDEVRNSIKGFLKPIMLVSVIAILLLLEPDFGAMAVITIITFGMLFIGGLKIRQFGVLFVLMLMSIAVIAIAAPYRMERLKSFLNPWADPFDSGFQLTQALIAFGRGEWFGVGLGGSIQKLFYLPEAHTDFLFSVISEELGLFGIIFVIGLFVLIVVRAFHIGYKAFEKGELFSAYAAYGIGLLLGIQAFTNIGVNMGVLPTKGLTLPLMSYGGSSIVVTCIACAVLLRIFHEFNSSHASHVGARKYRSGY